MNVGYDHRGQIGEVRRALLPLLIASTAGLLSIALPQCWMGLQSAHAQDAPADAPADTTASADSNPGPVRMARFSSVQGNVTWRPGTDGDWSDATINLPLRQSAQIWTSDASRSEVQFDDGSRLRLGSNTLVTLQTLYSDAQGEFTEITLNDGEVFLRLSNQYSVYQVNTPLASVKASGPARLRVGAGQGVQVGVRTGDATVEGTGDHATLHAGDYLDVQNSTDTYTIRDLPQSDSWDNWNSTRDQEIDDQSQQPGYQNLPSNIAICADNLNDYGVWRDDPQYGRVWCPTVAGADWRPYFHGHWTWVEPFGWTWVSTEDWGWAPYHYGTWVHAGYGWGWAPGPVTQCWSPGVVAFYQDGGRVGWCPLAPREVVYPSSLSVGFGAGNWSLFFSIGRAAVYYPNANNVCVARPWTNNYINRHTYIQNVTNITNVTNVTNISNNTYVSTNRNTFSSGTHFIPRNGRADGATYATREEFGGQAVSYHPVAASTANTFFARAALITAPTAGRPVAGPTVQPTRAAFAPTRTFTTPAHLSPTIVAHPIYRAPLPANVERFSTRPAQPVISRPGGQTPTTFTRPNESHDAPPVPYSHQTQPVTPAPPRVQERPTPVDTTPTRPRPDTSPGDVTRGNNNTTPTPPHHSSGLDAYLNSRNGGHNATTPTPAPDTSPYHNTAPVIRPTPTPAPIIRPNPTPAPDLSPYHNPAPTHDVTPYHNSTPAPNHYVAPNRDVNPPVVNPPAVNPATQNPRAPLESSNSTLYSHPPVERAPSQRTQPPTETYRPLHNQGSSTRAGSGSSSGSTSASNSGSNSGSGSHSNRTDHSDDTHNR